MMNRSVLLGSLSCISAVCVVYSCATSKKLSNLNSGAVSAALSLANEESNLPQVRSGAISRDTLKIEDEDGKEVFIMKAIKYEDGDMVAHDVIDAAVVTARFRNVAERSGKVDLCFNVTVPESMRDSRWQLRFNPDMYMLGDSVRLEPVIITGQVYRKAQFRGYQQYERFLSTIVRDSTKFINLRDVDLFIKRNIPGLYAFKSDTSYVSNDEFLSCYGVSEREVLEHYTNHAAKNRNERRIARSDKMYRKYVKSPIVSEGIRLDTIIQAASGDFIYSYTQTINTRPKLRKVDIVLSGDIYEADKKIYDVPRSAPLTFYISSISSFVDNREKYMTKVIERHAEANTACYVEFAKGSTDIDVELGNNRDEIGRIKSNLSDLLDNKVYDLDSIVVMSYASPEGKVIKDIIGTNLFVKLFGNLRRVKILGVPHLPKELLAPAGKFYPVIFETPAEPCIEVLFHTAKIGKRNDSTKFNKLCISGLKAIYGLFGKLSTPLRSGGQTESFQEPHTAPKNTYNQLIFNVLKVERAK